VDDGDLLAFEVLRDIGAGDFAPADRRARRLRKMFHIMRSVIFGLVADGVISQDPVLLVDFRGRHGDARIEVPDPRT